MATIFGDVHDNWLKGTNHGDTVRGNVGSDFIFGRGGDDLLIGDEMAPGVVDAGQDVQVAVKAAAPVKVEFAVDKVRAEFAVKEISDEMKLERAKQDEAKQDVFKLELAKIELFKLEEMKHESMKLEEAKLQEMKQAEVAVAVDTKAYKHAFDVKAQEFTVKAVAEEVKTSVADAVEQKEAVAETAEPVKYAFDPIEIKAVEAVAEVVDPEQNPTTYNDNISGNGGNDHILGNQGDDVLFGGAKWDGIERDHAPSYQDNDTIEGGTGNDQIWGNAGSDDLFGGEGSDLVFGGKGDDYIAGNEGGDALFGNSGGDGIEGGAGDDKIFGNSGDDAIDDGAGNDYVSGGSGDDHLIAGEGDDYYDGGSGFDTLNFYQAQNGVKVDLSKGVAYGMGEDHFKSVEGAVGSGHDDYLRGSKGDNLIAGNAGNDLIRGAEGSDTLSGGMGHDTFQYMKKDIAQGGVAQGVDTIIDFTTADTLDLKDITKGHAVTNIEDFIKVTDNGQDSTVYAKVGGQFHEVAHLTDFAGHSAADMLAHGMLLA